MARDIRTAMQTVITIMTDAPAMDRGGAEPAALLRLHAWLSPVFPTGGFAYSAGLERAVADGIVTDAASLRQWIDTLLTQGSAWNDAVLFALAWRADGEAGISRIAELAQALCGSHERHRESLQQGRAFIDAAANWAQGGFERSGEMPYCVAAGRACRSGGIALETALGVWLQAFASNQLQAAIRLSVTGQQGAAAILAGLEAAILEIARRAAQAGEDDLGGLAFIAEIASMNHETQHTRLFLS